MARIIYKIRKRMKGIIIWTGIVTFLIILPKMIDLIFSQSLSLFALQYLNASDILVYASTLIVIIATIYAALIAFKQYKVSNRTFIVPYNKTIFFYASDNVASSFLYDRDDVEIKDNLDIDKEAPIITSVKNIGKSSASDFSVIYDYNQGSYFYDLMSLLGQNKNEVFQSKFDLEINENVGVFNSEEIKDLVIPDRLKRMVLNICVVQYRNQKSGSTRKEIIYNRPLNRPQCLAKLTIVSNDILNILGKESKLSYDIIIEVDNSMAPFFSNAVYSKVKLTFSQSKE